MAANSRKTYGDTTASGHARLHLGDVQNNYSYRYNLRKRRSDETLLEDARNKVLLTTAAEGQTLRVRHLLHLGVDVDHRDDLGLTALHHACLSGFDDTAQVVLQAGADVNATSLDCGTPLHLAALKARETVVRLLLKYRAEVNKTSRLLGAPMHCAYFTGDTTIIDLLKSAHAREDIAAVVLPSLVRSISLEGDLVPQASNLQSWLCNAAEPNSLSLCHLVLYCFPFHLALASGRLDIVHRSLLPQRNCHGSFMPDIDDDSLKGTSASHNLLDDTLLAILFDQPLALAHLRKTVRKGDTSQDEQTLRQTAIQLRRSGCLKVLVDGLGIEKPSWHDGKKEIDVAMSIVECTDDTACLHVLLSCYSQPDDDAKSAIMLNIVSKSQMTILDCLLDRWQLPKASQTHYELTARASRLASNTILARLVHHGLEINALSTEHTSQWTALMRVVHQGDLSAVRKLLDLGALLDVQCDSGDTALLLAVRIGHVDIVSLLVSRGASLDLQNKQGSTALLTAVRGGPDDIVALLIDSGASLDLQDGEGNTALLAAVCFSSTLTISDSMNTSDYAGSSLKAKTIIRLLWGGASAKIRNKSGIDALEACLDLKSQRDRIRCVRRLLEALDAIDESLKTPLHRYFALRPDIWHACEWGEVDKARSQLPQHIREKVKRMEKDEQYEEAMSCNRASAVGGLEQFKIRGLFEKFKKRMM